MASPLDAVMQHFVERGPFDVIEKELEVHE
jgi:hypothetical protein